MGSEYLYGDFCEDEHAKEWVEQNLIHCVGTFGLEWLFETACDRLSPEEFDTFLFTAASLAADYKHLIDPPLTEDMLLVLRTLREARTTLTAIDLAAQCNFTRKTTGIHLRILEKWGLIAYPHGERKGAGITPLGKSHLDDLSQDEANSSH